MHPTEKNKIVIDEEVAPVVRRIFALALSGMSCRQIAALLNQDSVPTPSAYAHLSIARPGMYSGLWSGERISKMLQNETYIGNMVQGRRVKISYKSKKCLNQSPEHWVIVEGTHEPIIDSETFEKVQVLLSSRRHTRSRTYDFALKGLIFCHECGHPLSVINRKNAKGDDVLYFICRTYQRNTRAGVCASHSIQERTVTRAVFTKIQELCASVLQPDALFPIAYEAIQKAQANTAHLSELQGIHSKLDTLTANLDRIYDDRLSGLLSAEDFARIYQRANRERRALEERKHELSQQTACPVSAQDRAHALVQQFLHALDSNRALLVSLIARVELTQDKEIILYFRFHAPEAIF